MKTSLLRKAAPALVALAAFFAAIGSASAQVSIHIGGGGPPPPPPPVYEHRWDPPYQGAYWIAGHNEWRHGRWVWVPGYYAYPPYPGAIWVEGHVGGDGRWHPGHWRH